MKVNSLKHLAFILKCKTSERELRSICNSLTDKEYSFDSNFYWEKKQVVSISNGKFKTRIIHPSTGRLKLLQSKIKANILDKVKLPFYVQGSSRGCSNITNASIHLGNKYKFTTDIKSFFPSITPKQVYDCFISLGFNPDISRALTILTTYKGELPQGTSTSSHIANLVFMPIDSRLHEYCLNNGLTYTRYIDDITISSKSDFKDHIPAILKFITESGFKISARKTQYRHIIEITGIQTANNRLKPNRKFFYNLQQCVSEESKNARLKYLDRVNLAKKVKLKEIV